jgi:hypothetical protein
MFFCFVKTGLKDGPVLKAGAPLPLLNPEMQAEVGASN